MTINLNRRKDEQIHTTLHRNYKFDHYEPKRHLRVKSCASEG